VASTGRIAYVTKSLAVIFSFFFFVVILSDHALKSKYCRAELLYARALRKRILPVEVNPRKSALPPELAQVHYIRYSLSSMKGNLVAHCESASPRNRCRTLFPGRLRCEA